MLCQPTCLNSSLEFALKHYEASRHDIIPFIYPLPKYNSILDYLDSSQRRRQFHDEMAKLIQHTQLDVATRCCNFEVL